MRTKQNHPANSHPARDEEALSALVDGELERAPAEFLIRRLADDAATQSAWQRFHLQRACLQREFPGPVALVERVRLALESEVQPSSSRTSAWLRYGAGGAIAASVAVVALIGLGNRIDQVPNGDNSGLDAPAFVSQTNPLDRQFSVPATPTGLGAERAAAASPAAIALEQQQLLQQQRINHFMIRHHQLAHGQGFISLAPVLSEPSTVTLTRPARVGRESGAAESALELEVQER